MLTRAEFAFLAKAAQHDPEKLMARAFVIATKQNPGQPPITTLQLNRAQRKIHDAIMAARKAGQPPRIITLKARQPGVSTYAAGHVAATALCRPYANSMIVAHVKEASEKLFGKVRMMLDRLPAELHPKFPTPKKNEIHLDTMPCSDGAVGLHTNIFVGTASGKELWRGMTLMTAHLSEMAFWPDQEATLGGILQSVPNSPDSLVIIESTANGMGNAFQHEYTRAESGESGFTPVFIGWHEIEDYTMVIPNRRDFVLDPEEKRLKKALNLTDEQLQWRRYTLHTSCQGDLDWFVQEYPSNPTEAFLVTGRPAFPIPKLKRMREKAVKLAPKRGVIGVWGGQVAFRPAKDGPLAVWRPPVSDHDYVIGADIGAGIEGGDYSCAQVLDRQTEEVVATWHGHLSPIDFAYVLYALGHYYNLALMAPELTGGHGFSVVDALKKLGYPRWYMYQRVDRVKNTVTDYLGFETSWKTKPLMVDSMHWALMNDSIMIWDPATIDELMEYTHYERNQMEGINHDDRTTAVMVVFRAHLEMPMGDTGLPPMKNVPSVTNDVPRETEPAIMAGMPGSAEAWDEVDADLQRMGEEGGRSWQEWDQPDETPGTDFVPDIPW